MQSMWCKEDFSQSIDSTFGLKDLDIGDPIAKGCSAAVYAAALKVPAAVASDDASSPLLVGSPQRDTFPSIQNTSRFVHNFGGSVDNVNFNMTSQIDLDLLSSPRLAQRAMFATGERRQSATPTQRVRFDSINESEYEHVASNNNTNETMNDKRDQVSKSLLYV